MIFYETWCGGPGAVYPDNTRFRMPFTLPTPVQTAHAVLQSFHLEVRRASDSHVQDVVVMLTTHFDPFQSTTSGEIEVELQRTDSSGGIVLRAHDIEAEIRILVIGI